MAFKICIQLTTFMFSQYFVFFFMTIQISLIFYKVFVILAQENL